MQNTILNGFVKVNTDALDIELKEDVDKIDTSNFDKEVQKGNLIFKNGKYYLPDKIYN